MFYTFLGDKFYFQKYCETQEVVEKTIARCNKAYKTQDFYVAKHVRRVTDELGNIVFQDRNDRRYRSR